MQDDCNWQIGAPDSVGLDPEKLSSVIDWLDTVDGSNVHSILVARAGVLLFEHYRTGPDERWRKPLIDVEHGVEISHDLRSVTKVIVGLLIGEALHRNLIASLNEPAFGFFPEYSDLRTPEKDHICLRHLLTMSAGLDWDENIPATDPDHGEMRMWRSADRLRTALEPRLIAAPGTVWNYSGGCTELLGMILQKTTDKPLDEFAHDVLFEPLSISNVEWARHADGSPSASGGLRMRSRDLAKVGATVTGAGQWNGKQVLSKAWTEASLTPRIGADDRLFFYGYHWWLGRSLVHGRTISWAAGIGLGGQRLFVVPELDLAVVITAGHYADAMQAWLPLTILNRFVLSATTSDN